MSDDNQNGNPDFQFYGIELADGEQPPKPVQIDATYFSTLTQTAKTNADLLMEISHLEGRLEQIQAKALAKGCDCCALPKFNDVPGAGE